MTKRERSHWTKADKQFNADGLLISQHSSEPMLAAGI